jgi:hypothetical protein
LTTPTLGVATATSLQGIIGNVTPAAGTFTTVTGSNDASLNGLTVGRGAGAVSTNTAVGASALPANTTGNFNTSIGFQSLFTNTTGGQNTAIGLNTLYTNNGNYNVAVGVGAMQANTSGSNNSAFGTGSLAANTTASNNTAVGYQAGYTNTTGTQNVHLGLNAGYTNSTGNFNIYIGSETGKIATGSNNLFIGYNSGYNMTTGAKNTLVGAFPGSSGGLDIRTASNYAVISDGDGNRLISTANGQTLALDSAIPQTGTGITFPATQSASSNANTLDDYEEGTWTPTFFGTTTAGSPTYNAQVAAYTKIGRSVSVTCYISITNIGGMTGTLQIGGLPFTTMTGGSYYGGFAIAEFDGITFSSGRTMLGLEPAHGQTTITIYNNGSGVSASQQTIANIASSTFIVFSGTYFSA